MILDSETLGDHEPMYVTLLGEYPENCVLNETGERVTFQEQQKVLKDMQKIRWRFVSLCNSVSGLDLAVYIHFKKQRKMYFY